MNYRHAYHAGNFADVFKHVLLARMIEYLKRKESAFRVIDTHAGIGRYRLDSDEAMKTREADGGIRRFAKAKPGPAAQALMAPYLEMALPALQPEGLYPGSPEIAAHLTRDQDRMSFAELHPRDVMKLRRNFAPDKRVLVLEMDGYQALKAQTPPRERRGLVLIDPPFETPDEFERMKQAVLLAYAKWPTGIYALWYPVKADGLSDRFVASMQETGIPKQLQIELCVVARSSEAGLPGCGFLLINPPFSLKSEAEQILPDLLRVMGTGGGEIRIRQVTGDPNHTG